MVVRYLTGGLWGFVLAKKLMHLRKHLRVWAKSSFGSSKLKKIVLMQEVDVFDIIKEGRRLSLTNLQQEQAILENLREIHRQEEIYWRQRSRLQWLRKGDDNTKYFHAVANGRKNCNFILNIR